MLKVLLLTLLITSCAHTPVISPPDKPSEKMSGTEFVVTVATLFGLWWIFDVEEDANE